MNGNFPNRRTGVTSASRRGFLCQIGFVSALFAVPGAYAEQLTRKKTPRVEEGPFYPPKQPLDTDNDLIIVNDSITPALGEITHLSGRLLDTKGDPIRNALVEIWSVDKTGVYLADRPNQSQFDANFQGFGRFLTSSTGDYYFRTLKPVRYQGRQAPHIHFKVKMKGHRDWTTQLFVKGDPGNERDGVYSRINDEAARSSVTVDFVPLKDSPIGELGARFDIVLGLTPEDDAEHDDHPPRGPRGGPAPGGDGPDGGRGDRRPPLATGQRPPAPHASLRPSQER